ncbi:MAG: hypothetical protein NC392_16000 [Roseburia sp.]|nr:hypothetical protein [Roseburia sp.]
MLTTSIEINLPVSVKDYVLDETTEEMRNALLLYPSIANNTISHGRAAELLGMKKEVLEKIYQTVIIPEAVYNELINNDDYKEDTEESG